MSNVLFTEAELLEAIKRYLSDGLSWGEIARQLYPNEDPEKMRIILWRMANDGYYPKRNDLRSKMRLPKIIEIVACPECNEVHTTRCPKIETDDLPSFNKMAYVVVVGDLPDGAQVIGVAYVCSVENCNNIFVPNHPRRKKCYEHSPYRGKK